MRRRRSTWLLLLLLVAGAIAGSVVGDAFRDVLPLAAHRVTIGIDPPLAINLSVLTLTVGGTLAFNLGSVLGVALAALLYRRM